MIAQAVRVSSTALTIMAMLLVLATGALGLTGGAPPDRRIRHVRTSSVRVDDHAPEHDAGHEHFETLPQEQSTPARLGAAGADAPTYAVVRSCLVFTVDIPGRQPAPPGAPAYLAYAGTEAPGRGPPSFA